MRRWFLLFGVFFLLLVNSTTAVLADTTYIVQRGDTLASIARKFNTSISVLVEANTLANPNLIYPNQRLVIPGEAAVPSPTPSGEPGAPTTSYVVQRGDTLFRIANRFGVSLAQLAEVNGITNPNFIYVGQQLVVPGKSGGSVPIPTLMPTAVPPATSTPNPTAVPTQLPPSPTPFPTATNTPPPAIPTATAVPPTPTASPSGNLLPNPSFEGSWYHPNDIPELQIPTSWQFHWDEGRTGFGSNAWDVYVRPEVRVLSRQFLPPQEHGLFIFNGQQTLKIFKGGAPTSFRLFSDVALPAGTYQFQIKVFPDLVVGYEGGRKVWAPDPASGEVQLQAGTRTSGWLRPTFGERNTFRLNFTLDQPQTVRLVGHMRGRFAIQNNGWFVDDWSLVRLP